MLMIVRHLIQLNQVESDADADTERLAYSFA